MPTSTPLDLCFEQPLSWPEIARINYALTAETQHRTKLVISLYEEILRSPTLANESSRLHAAIRWRYAAALRTAGKPEEALYHCEEAHSQLQVLSLLEGEPFDLMMSLVGIRAMMTFLSLELGELDAAPALAYQALSLAYEHLGVLHPYTVFLESHRLLNANERTECFYRHNFPESIANNLIEPTLDSWLSVSSTWKPFRCPVAGPWLFGFRDEDGRVHLPFTPLALWLAKLYADDGECPPVKAQSPDAVIFHVRATKGIRPLSQAYIQQTFVPRLLANIQTSPFQQACRATRIWMVRETAHLWPKSERLRWNLALQEAWVAPNSLSPTKAA